MSFPYNSTIPAATNYPGNDQPGMLTNAATISSALDVDHVGFNNANCGKHKQVNFPNFASLPVYTNPAAGMGTTVGSAAPTFPQLVYRNQAGFFPMTSLIAFGVFAKPGATGAFAALNSFNLSGATPINCTSLSPQNYTVTLNAGVASGNNVVVLLSVSTPGNASGQHFDSYSFTNPVLTINTSLPTTQAATFSFAILQF